MVYWPAIEQERKKRDEYYRQLAESMMTKEERLSSLEYEKNYHRLVTQDFLTKLREFEKESKKVHFEIKAGLVSAVA